FHVVNSRNAKLASLNELAERRPIQREKYKHVWWRPEVMHLGIALRGVRLQWTEVAALGWRDWQAPFSVEMLLLLWPGWIHSAMKVAPYIAAELANHRSLALRSFRQTTFLMPGASSLSFGNQRSG